MAFWHNDGGPCCVCESGPADAVGDAQGRALVEAAVACHLPTVEDERRAWAGLGRTDGFPF